jgi:hypothetical protein
MPAAEILLPDDLALDQLRSLYESGGLQTQVDSEGDLIVTSRVSCYAIPTRQRDRILLLAFLGTKDDAGRDLKIDFANRVNNELATVRARVNQNDRVVFDYYIPVEGGITGEAIVAATRFFLQATAHAANYCDEADIVR